ncbi:hypothetical protein Asppvi_001582 [Aspergillus pseudoviridinutans]|uniref:Ankyrin repeat-containing domain protein n=1 Tax=Aspergillus pseudoviridinutans TaxID=1517512 RepID=A0A9P3ERW3_9EURO|nr:uncharacterized protein Asppvi_001582 [Aspergillus pseudoviridinutans]GIJ83065.1 hypothetical protein Asppvi_001582 [Aspergillus pseudoviridinutans]
MSFRHDDYTVAWICALPLEMAAAKAMLNKVHSPLPQPKTDHNAYTLGNVAGHNVVVACLPSGVYGTTSAATVLAHMLSTFPTLRFALMVGIGGGVPSKKADIRLGDVVVSMPTAASGGVIQYDYGKTLRHGHLQLTGSLNKPPQYLLTAVSQIRSEYMVSDSHFKKGISEMLQKQQISRPDQDWLFNPDYHHESKFTNCSECDQSQLVIRPTRKTNEPVIHYGLIASGNQVMKDAKTRDSMAEELDILCFEMEAAGLMDQLPCLVIRGICDYCDSHKNKEWQEYSALTAAAYTAALLAVVPSTKINAQPDQKTEFTAEEKACLRDLFITDPTDDRKALERRKGHRAPGTCRWILGTDELKNWLQIGENGAQKESNIFWLYGNPGTGKSTMAITLTEELPNQAEFLSGKKRLAYFFCDSGSEHQRTATSILRGLLYQLITQHKSLMKYLLPKYTEQKAKLFTSFDALWSVLMDMGQDPSISGTYCIIDALDECEPDDQWIILHEIDRTFSNSKPQHSSSNAMHFLITSRPYPEIRRYLSSFSHRDLSAYPAVTTDLKTMIQERVDRLSRQNNYPRSVMTEISQILEQRAEGTFLWVGIACDELERVQARKAVKTLQHLPQGLYSLYQKLFDTAITQCDEDDKPVILKLVRFVAIARRPFTIPELSEACELYPDDDKASRFLFTRELIDSCGFIIIAEDRRVRLLHGSVRDFLVKDAAHVDELKSHAALAERCIASIIRHYRSQANGKSILPKTIFLNYSVSFWPIHAGLAKGEFMLQAEQAAFFQLGSKVWTKWLDHYNSLSRKWPLDAGFSIFHAAARWGIDRLISWGCHDFKDGVLIDCDFRTMNGVTPLEEGARHGRLSTVGTLLRHMSEKEIIHQRVVEAAARNSENGRDIMRLLLEKRRDQIQITADVVRAAAGNWSCGKDVMALLLDQQRNQVHLTKEVVATIIERFDKSVVALLIDRHADHIQITEDIVRAAAENRSSGKDIMALFLDQQGDQIRITENALSTMVRMFDETMITLLLARRGNQTQIIQKVIRAAAQDYKMQRVFVIDILNRLEHQTRSLTRSLTRQILSVIRTFHLASVTKLLREKGDKIQITEMFLKAAVENRNSGKGITKFLLSQQKNQFQITEELLSAAAQNQKDGKDIIALLLHYQGDNIHVTEGVLKAAAENTGNGVEIIKLLLDQPGGHTQITKDVLKAAAGNTTNGMEIIKFLLDQQGDPVQVTEDVLKVAAGNTGNGTEIITFLLDRERQAQITEEVLKAAAENELIGQSIMELLLRRQGDVTITERVITAAAGNRRNGKKVLELLFEKQEEQIKVTKEVIKAAAGNEGSGIDILAFLFDQSDDDFQIADGVLLSAASSGNENVLAFLSSKMGLAIDPGMLSIARLYNAAKLGKTDIVEQLLFQGTPPDTRNMRGVTPLWIAASNGHQEVVRVLLQSHQVDVNIPSIAGRPPIFWAAAEGHTGVVRLLLEAGANPRVTDTKGDSPYIMARKRGHWDTAELLEEHLDADVPQV